jgi:hypothetical protein
VSENAQSHSDAGAGGTSGFDISVPHPARIYDYWLGGKDNFAADREAAEQIHAVMPFMRELSRANRRFLVNAVVYLVRAGIRQFLDIGTGLPAANGIHEVAQAIAPDSRVVYVDNDPIVLAHAQALLTSAPQGRCDYIEADARDPGKILDAAAATLDFSKPVAVMMLAVLHFIPDADDPHGLVRQYLSAVPSGSYLAVSHAASDIQSEAAVAGARKYNANSSAAVTIRTRQAVTAFFDDLDLVPPGIVSVTEWAAGESRPVPWPGTPPLPSHVGLASKP